MRLWLHFFLKLFLFWFLFFFLYRLAFLLITQEFHHNIPPGEVLESTYQGLSLDLSFACYFLFFPVLMVMAFQLLPWELAHKVLKGILNLYVMGVVIAVALLQAGELATYGDWHAKINVKVFFYLSHPGEGVRSATAGHLWLFWGSFVLQSAIAIYAWFKWIRPRNIPLAALTWKSVPATVIMGAVTLGFSFIGARGNLRPIPIDLSSAFYSKHYFLNDAAVNTPWHFLHSVYEHSSGTTVNPYAAYPEAEAQQQVRALFHCYTDTFPSILTTRRPNIVFIVQEGVSADMVGALGGSKRFTPVYDSLARESLIFPNLYANGWTSDIGHLSIFAGFPALPTVSAINMPDKYRRLPSLARSLSHAGYTTHYYYGGQSTYGNIKGFMLDNGADKVVDEDVLPSGLVRGRLGIHDPYMYTMVAEELPTIQQPYCAILFTLSTHSPYDIPTPTSLVYSGKEEPYARSVYYADSALGKFIHAIKQNGQYDNTLLVIIPDHSHASTTERHMLSPERYRIGMLLGGGALKTAYRGQSITRIVSQIDVPRTLLEQLHIDAGDFIWSRNILDPDAPEFASYVYQGGTGWIRPGEYFVWDYEHEAYYLEQFLGPESKERLTKEGKAFLQAAYRQYMEL